VPYKLSVLIASAALVAGCQSLPDARAPYIADGPAIVKAADWSRMATVSVTMDDLGYGAEPLRLKAGQPYKIELRNVGEKDHYYTAPEFFRSVAWRKLMVNRNAEIKVDYVTATEVLKKNGQLDLYLVPVKTGSYTVYCSIDDHRDKGLHSTIVVE